MPRSREISYITTANSTLIDTRKTAKIKKKGKEEERRKKERKEEGKMNSMNRREPMAGAIIIARLRARARESGKIMGERRGGEKRARMRAR